MTPEQEAKCREAFEAWLLNGNRFCCEPKDIFTAGYQAAWSAAQAHGVEAEITELDFSGDKTIVTFEVPSGAEWSAGIYRIIPTPPTQPSVGDGGE